MRWSPLHIKFNSDVSAILQLFDSHMSGGDSRHSLDDDTVAISTTSSGVYVAHLRPLLRAAGWEGCISALGIC